MRFGIEDMIIGFWLGLFFMVMYGGRIFRMMFNLLLLMSYLKLKLIRGIFWR